MALQLRQLTESDERAFFEGLSQWPDQDRSWFTWAWKPGVTYSEMLNTLAKESAGIDLADGRVPATMYYGFENGAIIGRLNIRHTLNDYLRHRGGHVGYSVAPKYRGQGYATEMLKQALPICSQLGIKDLLITCGDENTASWKVIEKFNAKLENKIWDQEDQEMIRRYWIKL